MEKIKSDPPTRSLLEKYLFTKSYIEFLKKENAELKQEVGMLESEKEELQHELTQLQTLSEKELTALKDQVYLQTLHEQFQQHIEALEVQIKQEQDKVKAERKTIKNLKRSSDKLRNTISRLVDQII